MITTRQATEEDVAVLAEVLTAVDLQENPAAVAERTRAWATDYLTGQVREPEEGSILCVIERDGAPVGRLRVVQSAERLFIAGIQIMPAEQGKGVGTHVITSLIGEGRANGLPIQLEVAKTNPSARELYLRLGFEQIAESDKDYLMGC